VLAHPHSRKLREINYSPNICVFHWNVNLRLAPFLSTAHIFYIIDLYTQDPNFALNKLFSCNRLRYFIKET
jgi:hypothetical protein